MSFLEDKTIDSKVNDAYFCYGLILHINITIQQTTV